MALPSCNNNKNQSSIAHSSSGSLSSNADFQSSTSATNVNSKPEYLVYDILGISKNVTGTAWNNMLAMRKGAKEYGALHKGAVYLNGQPQDNTVYLTFDDGPDIKITSKIVDILAENKVKGNFFFIGEYAKKYPDVVKKAFDSGNYIGSHCEQHANLTALSADEIKKQITDSQNAISKITGQSPRVIRPPYGAIDQKVIDTLNSMNCKIVLWSIDTLDWSQKEVPNIVKNVSDNLRSGDIILMHSDSSKATTAEALPQIIKLILDKGYKLGTLDTLCA